MVASPEFIADMLMESGGMGAVAAVCAIGVSLAMAVAILARAAFIPRLKAQLTGAVRSRWEWLCVVCVVSVGALALVAFSI